MHRLARPAKALVAAIALSAGLLTAPAVTGAMPFVPAAVASAADLPTHPAPVNGHGTVVATSNMLNGAAPLAPVRAQSLVAKAQKLTYRTTDSLGRPVQASGALTVPTKPWRGKGPRPIVALASSTQGAGKQCDASNAFKTGLEFRFPPVDVIAPYEVSMVGQLLDRGITVMTIDYPRDPKTGSQKYVDNIGSGQALIDAAAAAIAATKSPAKTPVAFSGFSQGGSAAGWAAENVHRYAPQLNVKASYVGGPPSKLTDVLKSVDGSIIAGVLGYSASAIFDNDPKLKQEVMGTYINAYGEKLLGENDKLCAGGSIVATGFMNTRQMSTTGHSLAELAHQFPRLTQALERQRLGQDHPRHKVLLGTARHDDIIPFPQVAEVNRKWKAAGTDVRFVVNEMPAVPGKFALNHMLPYFEMQPQIVDFLAANLNA